MKVAVVGSRGFSDAIHLSAVMEDWFMNQEGLQAKITEIISGGAKGADSLAADWARTHGIKLTEYLPDWDTYGKRAGFIRNEDIIKGADMVLAFWDGVSKGTQNSLSIAKRLKKPTLIVYF